MQDQTVYVFDQWGQLMSMTDRNDNKTIYSYDTKGHLTNITDPVGLQTTFVINGQGQVEQMTTPGGHVTKFIYSGNNLTQIIDAEGGTRTWSYEAKGWISEFTDERGNKGQDHYDQWGRITKADLRDGTTKTFKVADAYIPIYDLGLTATPGAGPIVTIEQKERISSTTDGKGRIVINKLNKEGQIATTIDDLGVLETDTHAANSRIQQAKDSYGFVTSYAYDAQGNTTSIVYGDYQDPGSQPKQIFGDAVINYHLLEDAERLLGLPIGKATQVSQAGGGFIVIGTSLNKIVVASGLNPQELSLAPPEEKGRLVVRQVYTLRELLPFPGIGAGSLQQIKLLSNGLIAIGYDIHFFDTVSADLIPYFLRDSRNSKVDLSAGAQVMYVAPDKDGKLKRVTYSSFSHRSFTGLGRYNFAINDLTVGDFNGDGSSDVAAVNGIYSNARPIFQTIETTASGIEGTNGRYAPRFNPDWNPPNSQDGTVFVGIPKTDYFDAGRKIATINIGNDGREDLVVATVSDDGKRSGLLTFYQSLPGQNKFEQYGVQTTIPNYVYALQAYETVSNAKTAANPTPDPNKKTINHGVIISADHLYLIPDATKPAEIFDYGSIGIVQAVASDDFNGDGVNDIAIADYNQNLKIFLLNDDHSIKEVQTSHVNTKPRQLLAVGGSLFITDGASGLDIKGNQYLAWAAKTPQNSGFANKTFKYDNKFNQLLEYVDELGRQEIHTLDAHGNSLTVSRGDNSLRAVNTYKYDSHGQIVEETDAEGRITKRDYDQFGRLVTLISGNGSKTESFGYDGAGNITKKVDGNGVTTTYAYDKMNRVTETKTSVQGKDVKSGLTYFKDGLVKESIDANDHITSYTYDGLGRKKTETFADGGMTRYSYDVVGDLASMTDQVGRTTTYKFDARHRLIDENQVTIGLDKTIDYNLTKPTNTINVYGSGAVRTTVQTFDRYQQLTQIENPDHTIIKNTYDDGYRMTSSQNERGFTTSYKYDALDRRTEMIDGLGQHTVMAYDFVGNMTSSIDTRNHQTSYKYDALNRRTSVKDAEGNVTIMGYDPVGNITSVTDARNYQTIFKYDELNRQIQAIDAEKGDTYTIYDGVGNVKSVTDANGHAVSYDYDELNRLAIVTDDNGHVVQAKTYDKAGRDLTVTDTYGQVTNLKYDNALRQVTTTHALGKTVDIYDTYGNMVSMTDRANRTSTYEYDVRNRRVKMTDWAGGVTRYDYDGVSNMTLTVDARQHNTNYVYDALNRRTEIIDAYGKQTITGYDEVGNATSVTDRLNHTTNYVYDKINRLTKSIDALGQITEKKYDGVSNIVTEIDAEGRVTKHEYDGLKRRVKTTDALNQDSIFGYDVVGNITSVKNTRNFITTFDYDNLNRKVKTTDARGKSSTVDYKLNGEVERTTDAEGRVTKYDYDAFGRLQQVTDANGLVVEQTTKYDAINRPLIMVDRFGQSTSYAYDDVNRQNTTTHALGDTKETYDAVGNMVEMIDRVGRVTKYVYDNLNRRTKMIDWAGGVTEYKYDAVGNMTTQIDARGNSTVYSYDLIDRRYKVQDAEGGESVTTYDKVGNVTKFKDADGRETTYKYDDLNRRRFQIDAVGVQFENVYDAVGNITKTIDELGRKTSFSFDELDRLTGSIDAEQQTKSITYDNVGNMLSQTDALGRVTNYKYDKLNRREEMKDALGYVTRTIYNIDGTVKAIVRTGLFYQRSVLEQALVVRM